MDPRREREGWVACEEGGRLPDREGKKNLYAQVFGTAEYFVTGRKGRRLDGFRLSGGAYQPIVPDARGWLWSEQLGLFVGLWQGWVGDQEAGWVRLYRPDGTLVPTPQEQAEAAKQRAEEKRQRAEAAETKLARLRALIQEQGRD